MREATWTPARLRALRRRLGLSQRAAAAAVGVTQATWSRYETGARGLSGPVRLLLAQMNESAGKNSGKNSRKDHTCPSAAPAVVA